jgi:hypothetical protein
MKYAYPDTGIESGYKCDGGKMGKNPWNDDDVVIPGFEDLREKRRQEIIKHSPPEGLTRRSRFTPAIQARVLEAVRKGATAELAAAYGGIGRRTLHDWIANGMDDPDSVFAEFAIAYREAEAVGALENLSQIEEAARNGDWRAAAWKLEKRFPESFGKTVTESRVDIKAAIAPVDVKELAKLTPEQLEALAGNIGDGNDDDDL